MKNETARREIESLDYYLQNHTNDYSEESHTAMMMAVKALDQEPCRYWQNGKCNGNTEVCEDAISRQAVLDLAKKGVLISNGNYESVCKAINELPPVNPQLCEDAISRQAVQDYIAKYLSQYLYNDVREAVEVIDEYIGELPPANPQPKTGHWILQPSNKEQGERDFIWWKCSECGQVIYSETEKDRREYHAFCGGCGAKMESEDEK